MDEYQQDKNDGRYIYVVNTESVKPRVEPFDHLGWDVRISADGRHVYAMSKRRDP